MSCHIWVFDKNLFSSVKNKKKTRSLKRHRQNRSIPLKLQIVKIYNQTKNRSDFAECLFKNLSADVNKFVKGIQKSGLKKNTVQRSNNAAAILRVFIQSQQQN